MTVCNLDFIGCPIATTLTWTYIYLVNNWKLNKQTDLHDALAVSVFDPKVRCDIKDYLMIGVPNMLTLVIEFIAYEVTVIYLGQVSVDIQATQILLLNFFSLVIMVSFGYQ